MIEDERGCSGGESFALRVLGDSMAPEFLEGEILNPAHPEAPAIDLSAMHGVVIQKAILGRRRASKRYV